MAGSIYLFHPNHHHRTVQSSCIFLHRLKGYRKMGKAIGKDTQVKIKLTVQFSVVQL